MKRVLFILTCALCFTAVSAQNASDPKAVKKAKKAAMAVVRDAKSEITKEGGNIRTAKASIDKALKNEYSAKEAETWMVAATVYNSLYLTENNKTYLQQPYDTVAMYDYLMKWFDYSIIADSLQQIPNAKGKTFTTCRDKFASELDRSRTNLINGGIFYFNSKSDFAKAYELFEKYYTVGQTPMLKPLNDSNPVYADYDKQFAYFPTLCGMRLEDYNKVLKYCDLGAEDEENGATCYRFKCQAYESLGDTTNWILALQEGIKKFPSDDFYYMRLLSYYDEQGKMHEMENFAKEMLESDPDKAYNYYVLGYINQQQKKYADAEKAYETAIEKDSGLTEAYINLGLCYMLDANEYMDSKSDLKFNSREYREALEVEKSYYEKSRPLYEKVRELVPDETNKWGLQLYQIYYKLNMGPEFDKIETILKAEGLL